MAKGPIDITVDFSWKGKRFDDAEVGLRAFAKDIGANFEQAAFHVIKRELKDYLDTVAKALFDRHATPWQRPADPYSPGRSPKDQLYSRSGGLRQSIIDSVKVEGTTWNDLVGEIGGKFPIRVHEFGATIRAKKQFLTIPLKAALDASGLPFKKSAKDYKNTFIRRSKGGNLYIFQKFGGAIVPLYLLVPEVYIPPRLGMKRTIEAGQTWFADRVVDQTVKALVAQQKA